MLNSRQFLLSAVAVLTLSGCSGTPYEKYNPFNGGVSATGQSADVSMREDTGSVTPLVMNSGPVTSDSSVTIFNNSGAENTPSVRGPSLPQFDGGIAFVGDSSVTIFPIEGAPMMMNGGMVPIASHNMGGQAMGQNYAPMGGAGNQVFFKNGSSRLGGGDMRLLSNAAEQAKFAPVNRITVSGYASQPTQVGRNNIQADILNLKESMNRTFAVSKKLIQEGVPAEKIKAVSWGATKSSGNERQDRRVDVIMGEQ